MSVTVETHEVEIEKLVKVKKNELTFMLRMSFEEAGLLCAILSRVDECEEGPLNKWVTSTWAAMDRALYDFDAEMRSSFDFFEGVHRLKLRRGL